jgi:hypothetical protein
MTSARQMNHETSNRHQAGAPQTRKWNLVAMGQVGLTGWTRVAAQPAARAVARRTGRPEAQILSGIAGFVLHMMPGAPLVQAMAGHGLQF